MFRGCLAQFLGIISKLPIFQNRLVLLQESFLKSQLPVELVESPDKGRHLLASRLVEPGESVVHGEAYAVAVLDSNAATHCHACLRGLPSRSLTVTCDCRTTLYCSESCMSRDSDAHKEECQLLQEGALPKTSWAVRLLVRCLTRRSTEGPSALGLHWLQPRLCGLPTEQEAWWEPVLAVVGARFRMSLGLSQSDLREWVSVIQNNCLTVTQLNEANNFDLPSVAAGLYLHASFLNHSCAPNCNLWFDGSRLQVRAIERVLPGHELTISYVHTLQLYQPVRHRQQHLHRCFGFECVCQRCKRAGEDPMELLFEAVLCPQSGEGCSGRVASRMTTSRGRCTNCSTQVNVKELAATAKKEREVLQSELRQADEERSSSGLSPEGWGKVEWLLTGRRPRSSLGGDGTLGGGGGGAVGLGPSSSSSSNAASHPSPCSQPSSSSSSALPPGGLNLHYLHIYDFHLAWDVLYWLAARTNTLAEKELIVGLHCCERVRRCIHACLSSYHPDLLRILHLEATWSEALAPLLVSRDPKASRTYLQRRKVCSERLQTHLNVHQGKVIGTPGAAPVAPHLIRGRSSGDLSRYSISPGSRFSPKPLLIDSLPHAL